MIAKIANLRFLASQISDLVGLSDVPQSMDQYMEPAQHGDQDVLNNSTEVHPSDRTNQTNRAVYRIDPLELDLAWVAKNPKTDMHSHPVDHSDSPMCVLLLTAVHPSGSDERGQ
ncbi:hypothetical protein F2Q70_00017404 [Brassica cretica]|uniref:Uncharacterized protein n=1 Tax=Brassica cretica TaxID=69181 RepID=A0A8S9I5M8_BRACR|nr:hypothetical protein F2Q70_00017404 [Brassica cretica]